MNITTYILLATMIGISASAAQALTKCIGAGGSISYVQGQCPDSTNHQAEMPIYDSDAASYDPAAAYRNMPASQEDPGAAGPSAIMMGDDPCDSSSKDPVQMRRDLAACRASRSQPDIGYSSSQCNDLHSEHYRRTADPVAYRMLLRRCGQDSVGAPVSAGAAGCSPLSPVERQKLIAERIVVPGMRLNDVGMAWGHYPTITVLLNDGMIQRTYTVRGKPRSVTYKNECAVSVSP